MKDDLDAVVSDYPTVAGPIVRELRNLHRVISQQDAEVKQTKADIENQRRQESERAHFGAIRKVHPDLDEINSSDDFQGWLSRQSALIQRAAAEGNASEVIDVLSRYKAAVGLTRKRPRFTRKQIAAMTPEQFAENEAAIDAAVAAGEVA